MGWKAFYQVGEDYFRKFYDEGSKWGDLNPYKVTTGGVDHYGVGVVSNSPTGWLLSPKIQHYIGKTRVVIKYFLWVDANATGKASIGIVFYKNDETSKDENGNDVHGAMHTVSTAPSTNAVEPHTMVVEQENNKIVITVDDTKVSEAQLQAPLTSFKLALQVSEASGGNVGIVITSVSAEYYDFMEDMIAQLMSVFNVMVWVFLGVSIIMMIIKSFKPRRAEVVR